MDAVLARDLDRVRELCEAGADPTRVPRGGYRSALQYAMWRTSIEVTEYLVSRPGLDLNARDGGGQTALRFVGSGPAGLAVTRLLVERGVDVNAADRSGNTPLFAMVAGNDLSAGVERFDYLLAHGADPAHRNKYGQTVLDAALASTTSGTRSGRIEPGCCRHGACASRSTTGRRGTDPSSRRGRCG